MECGRCGAARRIKYEDMALRCLLCLLHHVVSLWRSLVRPQNLSLEESARTHVVLGWMSTGRNNSLM